MRSALHHLQQMRTAGELRSTSGDDRLPIYQRLRDDLLRRIEDGTWGQGMPLPAESALAASYGVSLGTMRNAIAVLVREGILERRQGRGTYLRRPDFNYSLFRLFRCQSSDGKNLFPESRILSRARLPAPRNVAEQLQREPGEPVIRLLRLRLCNGEPLVSEEIWLPANDFAPLLKLKISEIGTLLYSEYERLCNQTVVSAKEDLFVDTATRNVARVLKLTLGSPVVVIERLAYGWGGARLEWRRSCGRADRFHYQIEIR